VSSSRCSNKNQRAVSRPVVGLHRRAHTDLGAAVVVDIALRGTPPRPNKIFPTPTTNVHNKDPRPHLNLSSFFAPLAPLKHLGGPAEPTESRQQGLHIGETFARASPSVLPSNNPDPSFTLRESSRLERVKGIVRNIVSEKLRLISNRIPSRPQESSTSLASPPALEVRRKSARGRPQGALRHHGLCRAKLADCQAKDPAPRARSTSSRRERPVAREGRAATVAFKPSWPLRGKNPHFERVRADLMLSSEQIGNAHHGARLLDPPSPRAKLNLPRERHHGDSSCTQRSRHREFQRQRRGQWRGARRSAWFHLRASRMFDIRKLRYHRLIDDRRHVDALHILTLFLNFLLCHLAQVIEEGYSTSRLPPLTASQGEDLYLKTMLRSAMSALEASKAWSSLLRDDPRSLARAALFVLAKANESIAREILGKDRDRRCDARFWRAWCAQAVLGRYELLQPRGCNSGRRSPITAGTRLTPPRSLPHPCRDLPTCFEHGAWRMAVTCAWCRSACEQHRREPRQDSPIPRVALFRSGRRPLHRPAALHVNRGASVRSPSPRREAGRVLANAAARITLSRYKASVK